MFTNVLPVLLSKGKNTIKGYEKAIYDTMKIINLSSDILKKEDK